MIHSVTSFVLYLTTPSAHLGCCWDMLLALGADKQHKRHYQIDHSGCCVHGPATSSAQQDGHIGAIESMRLMGSTRLLAGGVC